MAELYAFALVAFIVSGTFLLAVGIGVVTTAFDGLLDWLSR